MCPRETRESQGRRPPARDAPTHSAPWGVLSGWRPGSVQSGRTICLDVLVVHVADACARRRAAGGGRERRRGCCGSGSAGCTRYGLDQQRRRRGWRRGVLLRRGGGSASAGVGGCSGLRVRGTTDRGDVGRCSRCSRCCRDRVGSGGGGGCGRWVKQRRCCWCRVHLRRGAAAAGERCGGVGIRRPRLRVRGQAAAGHRARWRCRCGGVPRCALVLRVWAASCCRRAVRSGAWWRRWGPAT